jgi:hypothetical protein
MLRRADFAGNRMTGFLEAGKIPEVRKIPALLRFHGLHGAVVALQENALAIRLFLQGESLPVLAETGSRNDSVKPASQVDGTRVKSGLEI